MDDNTMKDLQVLPLHKHREYTNDCVKLLNSEWPRSETARLRSLNASCDMFPTSLVMIHTLSINGNDIVDTNGFNTSSSSESYSIEDNFKSNNLQNHNSSPSSVVVGHSKISRLFSVQDACFIESVVIHKAYRGKGWGKYLMEQSESYVKQFGVKIVYLTTMDKQGFYNRIGYIETEPIPIFGGLPTNYNNLFKSLWISVTENSSDSIPQAGENEKESLDSISKKSSLVMLPSSKVDINISDITLEKSVIMVNDCSVPNSPPQVPPPPPCPPPPPPPPPPPSLPKTETFDEKSSRSSGKMCSIGSNKTYMKRSGLRTLWVEVKNIAE